MRSPSLLHAASSLLALLASSLSVVRAIDVTAIASPDLDLSQLGRVALAGDFDAISIYSYKGQNEDSISSNSSDVVYTPFPNGVLDDIASTDAHVNAMCPFYKKDGTLVGIVVAGNFTSVDNSETQAIALYDPDDGTFTSISGLTGQVYSLLCDKDTSTVYAGGEFKAGNSTNAIGWLGPSGGWSNLAFSGFNGPVNTISKTSSGNIVFGGVFTGLGNTTTPNKKNQQIINLSSASITAESSTTTTGFSDPRNIICKTNGTDGSGDTWLLEDDTAGYWKANMSFGFTPTKLRLWNTHQDGRGTRTWRLTAFPINGIMNFTYTDPDTGDKSYCDARCPLSNSSSVEYQDFELVNHVGMNGFRIDISDWYGSGGGLDGIEFFEDDIYVYAINDFNEPTCTSISYGSNATRTGTWTIAPSLDSSSDYLLTSLSTDELSTSSNSVVFMPDIKQSGNYTVTLYTPGCVQDGTCESRGVVNVTGTYTSTSGNSVSASIYQTNNYDKYDQIYSGYVDANSNTFRPTVTLIPSYGPNENSTFTAQRVKFQLLNSTGGLNGLYEYDPSEDSVSSDYSNSTVDTAGNELDDDAQVTSLASINDIVYVGGAFTSSEFYNIFAISSSGASSLSENGLNSMVTDFYAYGDTLFVAGNFTGTKGNKTSGLSNVAAYDTSSEAWQALGAGVNGRVNVLVPFSLNLTTNRSETVISVNGDFSQVLASGNNQSVTVDGMAVWVPSRNNWLHNLGLDTVSISGQFSASANISTSEYLYAGILSSQELTAHGAVSLSGSGTPDLDQLPINLESSQNSSASAENSTDIDMSGVVTGLFHTSSSLNFTILAGGLKAEATNGSTIYNLAVINGSSGDVTGLTADCGVDSSSRVLSLQVYGHTLFAGGVITGTVNGASLDGLVLYDLSKGDLSTSQVPSMSGDSVLVSAISTRPSSSHVYVGGIFDGAGSLACPGVCYYDTSVAQWNRPGNNLEGNVTTLLWTGKTTLIAGGNLTVGGGSTYVASYSTKQQTWSALDDGDLPGTATAITAASNDNSHIWVGGRSTNGTAYLMRYDGKKWSNIGDLFGKSTNIRGLQVLSLTESHSSSSLMDSDKSLLVMGQLNLPGFGNASAALFNGTALSPFILSTTSDDESGSISQLFSELEYSFTSSSGGRSDGSIIGIAFACALGCVMLLTAIGYGLSILRRKREGYMPAPTSAWTDKMANVNRIPPEELFGNLPQGSAASSAPRL